MRIDEARHFTSKTVLCTLLHEAEAPDPPIRLRRGNKIFRENLEAIVPTLMENVLGIRAVRMEDLPDELQHTKERKPDVLRRVTNAGGETFVLHLEFQLADDPDMVYRMADYCVMLVRKYRLEVRQYVVFLGEQPPQMPTRLVSRRLQYEFDLIAFNQLDYGLFLSASDPEAIMLGVLANFGQLPPAQAALTLLRRVEETSTDGLTLQKHLAQLRILAHLRNLQPLIDTLMDSLAKHIRMENDPWFQKGREEGRLEAMEEAEHNAKKELVINLLKNTDFDAPKIATLAGVSVAFVEEVKKGIG